ncbi:MAG: citramalate synthase [Clostridia bacterium]|nr:citramalate synthase [Clostridia bacterium]
MIKILDSTLRDGLQGANISFSLSDKIHIVKMLDDLGISYIEAGNPGSNPKDVLFFEKAQELTLKNAKLCAFGSTRRKNINVESDDNVKSLLLAKTDVAVIFGKSWDLHVDQILNTTLEENLNMIRDTVQYIKSHDKQVIFDAEHFFDGYKHNSDYATKVIETAANAGADSICLCDTNGGMLPSELKYIVSNVTSMFPCVEFGIHAHNDSGMAVANSIMSVEAGVTHVQGTLIGFGERCGNADLSTIIPNLRLKKGLECDGDLAKLTPSAAALADIANLILPNNKPYVGKSAFTHKAGMHIDGVLKNSVSFEHISPESVGNKRNFLVSEVAGRGTIVEKIKEYAKDLDKSSEQITEILSKLKELENYGYQFEAADASFELLVKKILGTYEKRFTLLMYKTIGEFPSPNDDLTASATIQVEVGGQTEITAALGNGPVNALDMALRKALMVFFPQIKDMYLSDYKVRVLEQNNTTASKVRVLIESSDGVSTWSTVGVSNDIIEASLIALVDSIEYALQKL